MESASLKLLDNIRATIYGYQRAQRGLASTSASGRALSRRFDHHIEELRRQDDTIRGCMRGNGELSETQAALAAFKARIRADVLLGGLAQAPDPKATWAKGG